MKDITDREILEVLRKKLDDANISYAGMCTPSGIINTLNDLWAIEIYILRGKHPDDFITKYCYEVVDVSDLERRIKSTYAAKELMNV